MRKTRQDPSRAATRSCLAMVSGVSDRNRTGDLQGHNLAL